MKTYLSLFLLPLLSFAAPLSHEEAESRLLLVKYDQATQDAVGLTNDNRLRRKPFADLLKALREAGVNSVTLDFTYEKRPEIQEENNALAAEFGLFNQEGTPMLQACNLSAFGLPADKSENFARAAKISACIHTGAEMKEIEGRNKQHALVATYCRPVEPGFFGLELGFVSTDAADETFAENAKCEPENRDPVSRIFDHLGIKIELGRYAKTKLVDNGQKLGMGLELPFIERAPAELSMIDIINGQIPAEQLKGKVVIVGTTVPGRDIVMLSGKPQHGVYTYVFTYLALLNDKYRNMSRDEVSKSGAKVP